ncbi:MAG: iron-containing alcohol dehydrogenase [Deltaproteobacteria bacterium]|nr:iron-containing alcohol dehydrogenase [Deltaproteobacteria bacterium]MBN2673181.1 iron-containing alcohol dehydrogenase [Deltaproteobacteria bacterium]
MRKNSISIPTNWEALAGFSAGCPCGKTHAVDTRKVVVSDGAIRYVAQVAESFLPKPTVGVLADRKTHEIAGAAVSDRLTASGYSVVLYVVPDGAGERPHATAEAVADVERAMHAVQGMVAVGSGTVNDLAKLASFHLGVPYVVVPTAPSMNGYTSAIAAIMKDGLKQTVDCRQPIAVVADLDILCRAPRHLIQAGLGDLESKPVSTADFLLSSILRGTYYCEAPGAVVAKAEASAAACAEGLGKGDKTAIGVLTEALLLSGCSMKLAGSSSPASGGEHLISHYWDMTAEAEGRVEGFHGAQVGVATIVSATLYEYLKALSPDAINIERLLATRRNAAEEREMVVSRHGGVGESAAAEYMQKRLENEAYQAELEYVVAHWNDIWESLYMLKPAREIRSVLLRAGAAVRVGDVNLTPAHLMNSFIRAREIRGRFTVLDFAADIGVLEAAAHDVLTASGCLDTE